MSKRYKIIEDDGMLTKTLDPLQLLEKSLEILREAGWKLEYRERSVSGPLHYFLDCQGKICKSYFTSISGHTFVLIPPTEPEKDEWEEWVDDFPQLDLLDWQAKIMREWLRKMPRRKDDKLV